MKKFLFILLIGLILSPTVTQAATRVRGYYKPKTGSYVTPSYRSLKDSFKFNNYSTSGNVNPFTGKKGYKKF